jgi:hypothetical protein
LGTDAGERVSVEAWDSYDLDQKIEFDQTPGMVALQFKVKASILFSVRSVTFAFKARDTAALPHETMSKYSKRVMIGAKSPSQIRLLRRGLGRFSGNTQPGSPEAHLALR